MTILILSVVGALAISFLCSLLEATVLSLTPSQVAEVARRHPGVGEIWQNFKANIHRPIAVILIINTGAHTVGATIAGAQFEELFPDTAVIWFSLLFTYLMLQFTEILPKTLGVHYNRQLAPIVAYPLELLYRVLAPFIFLIQLINRPFEGRRKEGRTNATLEEITALAGLARLSKLISPHQERIIMGASRLSRLTARELMIPSNQIAMLSTSQSLADAIIAAHLDPHTRFPVCEEANRDQVLGYVNFKEMIYHARTNPADMSLRGIIRPVRFVALDDPAPQVLQAFVEQHEHMAMVRDKDGHTLGLITLEDVIEELVGELEDEFDRLPRMLHPLTSGTWMVGGGLPVRDLASRLDLTLTDTQGTTSAWLIRRFGRLPKVGEVLREDGATFMARRIRRGKIFEVAVTVRPRGNEPRDEGTASG